MMNQIPYGRQNITQEDIDAVVEVLKSDLLTQGPKIAEFENAFAEYIGAKYAVAVSNGTAALHLCTLALGVKNGDKVITTPITFAATANCVRYAGGDVVFADINPDTYLLDINEVEKLLKAAPRGTYKGIIPVDFAGRAINLEAFRKLANEYDLWIIEDACHSPGGFFIDSNEKKQNCGNGDFAELAIFSFHPVKHIAAGEGGMITTNNEELYHKLRMLRTHGIQQRTDLKQFNHGIWYYEMQELGFNYRLTDFQAALGTSQLKRADNGLKRRYEIAEVYNHEFADKSYIIGQSGLVAGHAYHLYVVEFDKRKELIEYLREKNIFAQVHYIPVHLMPYYRQFGWKEGDLPNAENYYDYCLSVPMYPTLTEKEQSYVIETIHSFYKK
jgi:UDP-4-amino-4,6-dideoxy-N-acetyl-beta-L-altrosamine transaminase